MFQACVPLQLSNYLQDEDLLELGTMEIAEKVKGKTTEEIREQFNIENDFTPEELAAIQPYVTVPFQARKRNNTPESGDGNIANAGYTSLSFYCSSLLLTHRDIDVAAAEETEDRPEPNPKRLRTEDSAGK